MQKGIESFRNALSKIRTGRPHPGVLDHIHVDYYGTSTPINQVANISLADARTLLVNVWEKSMAVVVEKAIRDSDLGVNPQSMGTAIRVPMPRSPRSAAARSSRSPSTRARLPRWSFVACAARPMTS